MATAAKPLELTQLNNILFPTDFSAPSETALPFAASLARRYGATVHALHVCSPGPFVFGAPDALSATMEAEQGMALDQMRQVEAQLTGLQHETVVQRALNVWVAVEQAIRDFSIDMIVLGTHGRTGAQRFLLGSVAEEIFRRSQVPVLTVGPAVRTSTHCGGLFHRILFATDFSDASVAAAPYAVALAEKSGARLVLLHVARMSDLPESEGDRRSEWSVAEMIHRLYETVPKRAQLAIPPEVAVEYGTPAKRIVEAARDRNADLIVMGVRRAHGHLTAATHVERATAHDVVAHAPCPVLTVREQ